QLAGARAERRRRDQQECSAESAIVGDPHRARDCATSAPPAGTLASPAALREIATRLWTVCATAPRQSRTTRGATPVSRCRSPLLTRRDAGAIEIAPERPEMVRRGGEACRASAGRNDSTQRRDVSDDDVPAPTRTSQHHRAPGSRSGERMHPASARLTSVLLATLLSVAC